MLVVIILCYYMLPLISNIVYFVIFVKYANSRPPIDQIFSNAYVGWVLALYTLSDLDLDEFLEQLHF